jgi:erythromycin esterase-like protein
LVTKRELPMHYFDARLGAQFDAVIHFDATTPVTPLDAVAHRDAVAP